MAHTSPLLNVTTTPPPTSLVRGDMRLSAPPDFDFWRSAYSHGWCDLFPFSYNAHKKSLDRLFELRDGILALCTMTGRKGVVNVTTASVNRLSTVQRKELATQVRTCLRMEEDFREFHTEARTHPEYRWIAQRRAGRLLRAPTVFEDVVKMICTTNCTWALTVTMVTALVRALGKRFPGELYTFPSPETIASAHESFLRSRCKTGYRSAYILELAKRVATGELEIESWRTSPLPTDELFAVMCSIKGIGPYAAGNLLKLVGHYDQLALDSWVRGKFAELHTRGRRVKDSSIETYYRRYGKWRGLLFWLEMTRDWHEEKFRR